MPNYNVDEAAKSLASLRRRIGADHTFVEKAVDELFAALKEAAEKAGYSVSDATTSKGLMLYPLGVERDGILVTGNDGNIVVHNPASRGRESLPIEFDENSGMFVGTDEDKTPRHPVPGAPMQAPRQAALSVIIEAVGQALGV